MNVDQPTPGSTVDDISAQVNILVQNAKDGGSPTDPLNVIPDEYEYEEDFGIEEFDQEKIQLKYSSNDVWLAPGADMLRFVRWNFKYFLY